MTTTTATAEPVTNSVQLVNEAAQRLAATIDSTIASGALAKRGIPFDPRPPASRVAAVDERIRQWRIERLMLVLHRKHTIRLDDGSLRSSDDIEDHRDDATECVSMLLPRMWWQ